MKLSIITISYNNAIELDKTISSVLEQSWTGFEYIIIDGGSTDKSVEIIKSYQNRIAYWVSEPDAGIYNAMNKGISKAVGEYLLMLNAGDFLCDKEVLKRIFSDETQVADILAGDVYRAVDGKIFAESHFPATLTFDFLRRGTLSHQAAFIKKHLHDTVGLYDEQLKFGSDWKFFILAVCKYNASYKHLPFFITTCDAGGLTSSPKNFQAMKQENEQVLAQYFPAFLPDYAELDLMRGSLLKNRISAAFFSTKGFFKTALKRIYTSGSNKMN